MRQKLFCGAAAILIAAALFFLRAPGEPGVFMRDFEAYWSAGRAVNNAADPYAAQLVRFERAVPGVDPEKNELLPFAGAPPSLALWSVFARLEYPAAARCWSVVLAIALAALLYAAFRLCSGVRRNAWDACALTACALSFVPVTSDFGLGQAALVAYAAAAAAVASIPFSVAGSAAALFVAALQPNVSLGAAVLLAKPRGIVAAAAAVFALYALGTIYAGLLWPVHYFTFLLAHGAAERFAAIQYTPASIAFGYGAAPPVAAVIGALVAIAAVVAAAIGIARSEGLAEKFAVACAALPLAAGFMHEHDLVLLLIPALWALRHMQGRMRAFAIFASVLCSVNWMDFAQQPQAAAQDITLAAGFCCAALAWSDQRTPSLYLAATAAFLVVCAGAWIGAHYPAPIWPNGMAPFSVPANATAAQIWQAEQRATGLENVEPAWAALRTFSLAGSLLLLTALCFRPRTPSW